jgi:hypothetical protein
MTNERKSIISATWDQAAGTITFGVAGIGTIVLDLNKALATSEHAMYHGYEQKVRDAAAIPRDPTTGKSASPQEKFEAMERVVLDLHNGVWNTKASQVVALNRAALYEAVAEVRGVEPQVVEQRFRDRQDAVLRAFLTHGDIAAAYARRTARNSGQADKLLAELE